MPTGAEVISDILADTAARRALAASRTQALARLRAALLRPIVPAVMGSPPTLAHTANAYSAAVGGGVLATFTVAANDARITPIGVELYPSANSGSAGYFIGRSVDLMNSTILAGGRDGWGVQFMTDAPDVDVGVRKYGTHARVVIDDLYVSLSNYNFGGITSGYASLNIPLGNAGVPKKVRVEFDGPLEIIGVKVAAHYSVWKAPLRGPKLNFFSDSYGEGTGHLATNVRDAMAWQAAQRLGIEDVRVSAWGGTGFVNDGTTKKTYLERITDITRDPPDLLIVLGGVNDSVGTSGERQAAIAEFFAAAAADLPGTLITFFGTQRAPSADPSTQHKTDFATAGAAALGSRYVDISGWITGTTFNGTGTQNGNAHWFIGADGIHTNSPGHGYYGGRIAADVASMIRAAV